MFTLNFTVTYDTVYNYSPQYTYFAVYICFPFHNANIFQHITVELYIYTVYIESSLLHAVLFTITLPSTLTLLFTYAFLFTMRIFFHSYCIIFYSTMFTVRLHLIHAVLLQLVCALYIHTFPSTMIMFKQLLSHNTAIKITVNVQRLHTVLFTITLPSTRTVLFIYAFLFTMWIFSTHYCTIIYMTMFTFPFPLHYVNIFLNYSTIVYIQCWN